MTHQSLKLSDEIMELLRSDAAATHRSIEGQAEYYLRLGRAIASSPDFDQAAIHAALTGKGVEVSELSLEEQEAFFAEFATLVEKPSAVAEAFFEERQRQGLGVGETEDGRLVYAAAGRR